MAEQIPPNQSKEPELSMSFFSKIQSFTLALSVSCWCLTTHLATPTNANESDTAKAQTFASQGVEALRAKKYHESEILFEKAIALDPNMVEAQINLGVVLATLGDHKSALARLDAAIQLDNTMPVAFNARGLCKSHLKDYSGAIADFDRAVELMPTSATYLSNRAVTKMDMGDNEGARKDLEAALKLSPNDKKAQNNLHILNSGLANSPKRSHLEETQDPRYRGKNTAAGTAADKKPAPAAAHRKPLKQGSNSPK